MTAFNLRGASGSFDPDFMSRPARVIVSKPRPSSLAGVLRSRIARLGASFHEYVRRQRVMAELSRLTDRELADIGLSRSEIGLIYSQEFAAKRNAERMG